MGGNAFPELKVPRLPPAEYRQMRDSCMKILHQFYKDVVCPAESPGKVDYGDVDLMVSNPIKDFTNVDIGLAFKSRRQTKTAQTTSFAVAIPSRFDTYAQVDVHVCQPGRLEWELWMNSYGDLVQILGILNRPFGLTMNNHGLHYRVPEVEKTNRKVSMLFLTDSPSDVMKFIGLDEDAYNVGFEAVEEMFLWCTQGTIYSSKPRGRDDGETTNDRARVRKREVFRRYVDEWVPSNDKIFEAKAVKFTKEDVLRRALEAFNVKDQYEAIIGFWNLQRERERKLKVIKDVLLEDGEPISDRRLKETMRGLKRWVSFSNGFPTIKPRNDPNELQINGNNWLDQIGGSQLDEFLVWFKTHHEEVRLKEREWSNAKAEEGYSSHKITADSTSVSFTTEIMESLKANEP